MPLATSPGVPPAASNSLGVPSLLGPALRSGGAGGERSPSTGDETAGGAASAPRTSGKAAGPRTPARDWVIALECRADAFILYPGGTRIPAAALGMLPDGDNALAKAVREEIARRQARVRGSDTPDRPQLRFLVRPDGTRAYYRAFPLLEPLNVPMTRMNLEMNEELGLEHLTR